MCGIELPCNLTLWKHFCGDLCSKAEKHLLLPSMVTLVAFRNYFLEFENS